MFTTDGFFVEITDRRISHLDQLTASLQLHSNCNRHADLGCRILAEISLLCLFVFAPGRRLCDSTMRNCHRNITLGDGGRGRLDDVFNLGDDRG